MGSKETGKLGEDYVCRMLEAEGYRILRRNFHTRYGEVDIVAEKGEIVAFVEVKTRSSDSLDTPAASVTLQKRRRVTLAAMEWLQQNREDCQPRFDVAEVTVKARDAFEVLVYNYIESAFDAVL